MKKWCLIVISLFSPQILSSQNLEFFDSPNVLDLLEDLPFEAPFPIAQEIRYTYSSILELKKKKFDPYLVTNEHEGYFDVTKNGISGQVLQDQYNAFQAQGRTWIQRNQGSWSASELQGYTSFQRSMESSMSTMHTYYSVMGALAALGNAIVVKQAESLVEWTANVTKCRGSAAPEGSVMHLNMMRLTKGERFKFHSANDFLVTVALEKGDGSTIMSTQVMQLWANTKKNKVAPEHALPMFQHNASEEKLAILNPVGDNGFTIRFALLLNAVVKDLYAEMENE